MIWMAIRPLYAIIVPQCFENYYLKFIFCIFVSALAAGNQHYGNIIYISAGCSGSQQSACFSQRLISIIVLQCTKYINSREFQTFLCIFVAISAGSICRTVRPVTSDTEYRRILQS